MKKGRDSLLIGLKSGNEVLLERAHAIAENANAVEEVADYNWLEDVEFELAVHARDGGGNMVAHDLSADHGKGLALSGVHLARHDGRAGLVLRQNEFRKTAARTGSEIADILSDLEQRAGEGVQGAGGLDDGIVSRKDLELVGRGLELSASQLADLLSNSLIESLVGVQAGTDSSAALSQQPQIGEAVLNTLDVAVELGDVSGEFLAEGERSSVLQVSSTNLDDLFELLNLLLQRISQALQRGKKSLFEFEDCGNVHDGGEGIVGGRGSVNVVVGMDRLFGAHLATEDLNCTVRDDLVGIHVGLCAGTGLPDDQGEVVHHLSRCNLSSSLLDGLSDRRVCRIQRSVDARIFSSSRALFTKSKFHVDSCGSSLEDTEGLDDRLRHAITRLVDVEIRQGPIPISR